MLLEKTLESPLDSKEIKPVHLKGNQHLILIGRTGVEAKTPIIWPPDVKNWLIGKDPHAGKDWGQKEKGTTEDAIVGWHHWFNEHEFKWTLGDSEGQRSLVCCSSWGHKQSDMTYSPNKNCITDKIFLSLLTMLNEVSKFVFFILLYFNTIQTTLPILCVTMQLSPW